MKKGKKDCFSCVYVGHIEGDSRVSCRFNWAKSGLLPPAAQEYATENGYYTFPQNFEPVWQLEDCAAHTKQVEENLFIKTEFSKL